MSYPLFDTIQQRCAATLPCRKSPPRACNKHSDIKFIPDRGHPPEGKKKAAQIAAFLQMFRAKDRRAWLAGSAPFNLGDFVGLGAPRSHDLDRSALLLADQRARQRRGD